jgi:hypothetical protein
MSIRIRAAQTAEELDAVYRLRHRVFSEEEGLFAPDPEGRVTDRFDALPSTVNLVAVDDGQVVGALRLTEPSPAGLPTDGWFDFSPALPSECAVGAGGMLCVQRSHRECPRLFLGLVAMAHVWLLSKGCTHVVALFRPEVAPVFEWVGGTCLSEPFIHEGLGLPVVPVMITNGAVNERLTEFSERQHVDHFLRSFEREFASEGEVIVRRGDVADDSAYVIIDGRVAVTTTADDGPNPTTVLAELGPGEVFGELAPLTSQPRTANVVALGDVDLMVLDHDALLGQLQDPTIARHMLAIVAERLASRTTADFAALVQRSDPGRPDVDPRASGLAALVV